MMPDLSRRFVDPADGNQFHKSLLVQMRGYRNWRTRTISWGESVNAAPSASGAQTFPQQGRDVVEEGRIG